jgi:hypothetical protein
VKIYERFLEYINNNDLIGADMARKYIQFGIKNNSKICGEKLELIKNNIKYNEWINKFNWKNTDPYKPIKFIL